MLACALSLEIGRCGFRFGSIGGRKVRPSDHCRSPLLEPTMFIVPVSATLHRRAFQRPLAAPVSTRSSAGGSPAAPERTRRAPRLDVVESDTAYSVVLDMPGVAKDQLDVQVDGRCVTVSTKAAAEAPAPGAEQRILYRERGTAPYARTVTLPDDVDNTQSQARLENGVLTLTLAKRAAARATQIQVN
jgi:HSP20 family protein